MTLPDKMKAMVTMGQGDLDQIVLCAGWPRPDPAEGDVLIRVGACGLNNTDVNTRTGWYSKTVTQDTPAMPLPRSASKTPHGALRQSPFRVFKGRTSVVGSWLLGAVWTWRVLANALLPTTGCVIPWIRQTSTRLAISGRTTTVDLRNTQRSPRKTRLRSIQT